ncbi:MAG: CinA family nicotinamide mononucleotide deamidase-related protein, partial [Geobacteraceae bacterium]
MKIATLSIGNELVLGEIAGNNAAFIAERLYAAGLQLQQHLAVGDVEPDIMEAILSLAEKCEAVIVTGGLGPTIDDITARAAAKATARRLVLNEEALAHVKEIALRQGGAIHPFNEKQALLPAKSTLIPNPVGAACGFHLTHNGRFLFFLPGVPGEMSRMLEESVLPFLLQRCRHRRHVRTKILKVFDLPEAEVNLLLRDVALPGTGLTVSLRVEFPEIQVKLRAEGDSDTLADALLDRAVLLSRERLKGRVFAEDGETIDSVVAGLLRTTGLTLSLAESCTGGLLAKRLTDMPGSSAYFLEGIVTYADGSKSRNLHVPAELLAEKGAVSAEVAMAMARGSRRVSGSDVALAVTGIA